MDGTGTVWPNQLQAPSGVGAARQCDSARQGPPWSLVARLPALLLAIALTACASLSPVERQRTDQLVDQVRDQVVVCDRHDACAQPSAVRDLGARAFAESTQAAPRHYAVILDQGSDALLARINMIRSATTAIDLQTYIFDEDDAGWLVLEELLAAARRGVRVRLLIDQLAALRHVETLAALAGAHANFQLRLYNPVLHRARISYPRYALAAACCWRRLNQRMHTKLLLVDGAIGIAGGRNYQDAYYDWDEDFNFRDRDVLVAGPVAREMGDDFESFWGDDRSVPVEHLADVSRLIRSKGVPAVPLRRFERPERVAKIRADAADASIVDARLVEPAFQVGAVEYIADPPGKREIGGRSRSQASERLRGLVESARDQVVIQTPYLVLSDPARQVFEDLQQRREPPRVLISTNSLASTDAFFVYALSFKYRRRYLRELGFTIYEYKPFPLDTPVDVAAVAATTEGSTSVSARTHEDRDAGGAIERFRTRPLRHEYGARRFGAGQASKPVPLARAGVRVGIHAKSLVVDGSIGVIGTHNFDPRGDQYNTESAVVIRDLAFASALEESIRRDIAPPNSWVIARREKPPVLSGLNYSIGKSFEQLPVFDLWPWRYAVSYDFMPGPNCPQPMLPDAAGFHDCYRSVGDFPEVSIGLKGLATRLVTAFGSGLQPIF